MSQIRTILGGPPFGVNGGLVSCRPHHRARRSTGAGAAKMAVALFAVCLLAFGASGCPGFKKSAPLSADEAATRGLESLQQGEGTRAAALLTSAIQLGKKDDRIQRGLAASYVLAGDTPRAIAVLEAALVSRPRDAGLWSLLGSLQLQSGESSGVASLARAASLSRAFSVWRDYGEAQMGAGDPAGATRSLTIAWRTAPEGILKAQIAVEIGDAQTLSRHLVGARAWYRRSLAEDPNNAQAKAGLARIEGPRKR